VALQEATLGHALHASQGSEVPAAAAEQQAAMCGATCCHGLAVGCRDSNRRLQIDLGGVWRVADIQ
jgi:hypothetical protein